MNAHPANLQNIKMLKNAFEWYCLGTKSTNIFMLVKDTVPDEPVIMTEIWVFVQQICRIAVAWHANVIAYWAILICYISFIIMTWRN